MSKRVKSPSVSLGPSVGDDPDEVYLATLVQECKARGLGATRGHFFTYKSGDGLAFDDDIECCCAEGARMLACQTDDSAGMPCSVGPREGMMNGNDVPNQREVGLNPKYLAGFTIGMCFQDAMADEGTDEGTEP